MTAGHPPGVAGYHRMFFERNIPVDFPSARELTVEGLRRYALVIVPCPILMSGHGGDPGAVRVGGRLFVEARPGWQDERGHASPVLPGFGWDRLFGVRETDVLPIRQATVSWGDRVFGGHLRRAVRGRRRGARRAVRGRDAGRRSSSGREGPRTLLGSFAGERNATDPVAMHPLGDLLAEWAGLARPALTASGFVEVSRLPAPRANSCCCSTTARRPHASSSDVGLGRAYACESRELVIGRPRCPASRAGQATFRLVAEIGG